MRYVTFCLQYMAETIKKTKENETFTYTYREKSTARRCSNRNRLKKEVRDSNIKFIPFDWIKNES